MKSIAIALLIVLLPTAAGAQTSAQQQRSSGNKLKWLGIAGIIGGAGLAVYGFTSGKETATNTSATCPGGVTTAFGCAVPAPLVPQGTAVGNPLDPPSVPSGSPGGPLSPPSVPGPGVATASAVFSPVVSPAAAPFTAQRGANWKLVGPAIGAAGLGAFLFHRGQVRVKNADLSIRQDGALHVAFSW